MKSSLFMFTALSSDSKIPFDVAKLVTAAPINGTQGTILYGLGGVTVQIKEPIAQVNELVGAWYTGAASHANN